MRREIACALLFGAVLFCLPLSSEAEEILTYAEYQDAEMDSYVTVETYVQDKLAYNSNGTASVFAQSEDGAYYIYAAEMDEETYDALTAGMKIKVSGYKAKWSGETEIVDGQIEILDDGETFIAEPLDVTRYLSRDDLILYQNSRVICTDMTIESSIDPDGNPVPFLYAWDGTGGEGDDLYFSASHMGITYRFMVESDLCDADSTAYRQVLNLKTGDTVTLEGYLYYYEGPLMNVTEVTAGKGAAAAADKAVEDEANDEANETEDKNSASGNSKSSGSSKSSGRSTSGSRRRSSSSGSSSQSDPYNVEDYDDPELFYDDNYLDFDSFEDAEVYWDDAQ